MDNNCFFLGLSVHHKELSDRLVLVALCLLGMDRVLQTHPLAPPNIPSNNHLIKEQLMGAGYDKCLQVLGEIGRCPALLAQDRESFLEACSGDI